MCLCVKSVFLVIIVKHHWTAIFSHHKICHFFPLPWDLMSFLHFIFFHHWIGCFFITYVTRLIEMTLNTLQTAFNKHMKFNREVNRTCYLFECFFFVGQNNLNWSGDTLFLTRNFKYSSISMAFEFYSFGFFFTQDLKRKKWIKMWHWNGLQWNIHISLVSLTEYCSSPLANMIWMAWRRVSRIFLFCTHRNGLWGFLYWVIVKMWI